jgi:iron-sulfur cluster repair protein YtfE (RIC family)
VTDLFTLLGADHDRILALSSRLTGGSSVPSVPPRERKAIADQMMAELSRHEVAEEMLIWPLVRERVDDGDQISQIALNQEQTGKRALSELAHTSPGSEEFDTLVHTVAAQLREHISYEQNIVWPKLRLRLTDEEARQLGTAIERAERRAPSRPHPHVPPNPGLLRKMAPAAAVLDRVRNAVIRHP